jgi:hypothetical protein
LGGTGNVPRKRIFPGEYPSLTLLGNPFLKTVLSTGRTCVSLVNSFTDPVNEYRRQLAKSSIQAHA